MPMPIPRAGETESKFIGRCMGDPVMRREFPDNNQRAKVCYVQWRKRNEKEQEMEIDVTKIVRCSTAQTLKLHKQSIKEEKNGDLTFWAVAVDKNKKPNRKGFIFDWKDPKDVDVSGIESNGVVTYMHDYDALPAGRIEQIEVNRTRMKVQIRIPAYEELEPLRRWIKDGYLKAVSIGFYLKEYEEIELSGGERKEKAIRVTKFTIIEVSIVTIGAHESALIKQDLAPVLAERFGVELESQPTPTPTPEPDDGDAEPSPTPTPTPAPSGDEGDDDGEGEKDEDEDEVPSEDWYGVATEMAKALGARGAIPDRAKYDSLLPAYKRFEKAPPIFAKNYGAAQLRAFHNAGHITIPGLDPAKDKEDVLQACQSISAHLQSLQESIDILAERMGVAVDTAAPAAVSAPTTEALAAIVTAVLENDPAITAQRHALVQHKLEQIRLDNTRRMVHHGR